jgi:hypothetical protein
MQPSDSLVPISRRSSHPSPTAYLRCGCLFFAARSRTRKRTERRKRVTGSPNHRFLPEEKQGPPRFLGRPLRMCRGRRPRRVQPPLAHVGEVAVAFRQNKTLGTRNEIAFVAAWPTAHTFAYLRIAERVTTPVARLATDPGGLTPGRAGFAPAGRQTKFHEVIAYSVPLRPACPGRTILTIPRLTLVDPHI